MSKRDEHKPSHPKSSDFLKTLGQMKARVKGANSLEDLEFELVQQVHLLDAAEGAKIQVTQFGITNMSAVAHLSVFRDMARFLETHGEDLEGLEGAIRIIMERIKELKSRICMLKTIEKNEAYLKKDDPDTDDAAGPDGHYPSYSSSYSMTMRT